MSLTLITPPAVEPVEPDEVRARFGYGSNVTDAMLTPLIKASRQSIDGPTGWIGRAIVNQAWAWTPERLDPCRHFRIPLTPLVSISSFKVPDVNGDFQDFEDYLRSGNSLFPRGGRWPSWRYGGPEIQFVAGFGAAAADVPEPIRTAILLQVGYLRSLTAQNLFISADNVDGVGSKQYIVGSGAGAVTDQAVTNLLRPYRESCGI